MFGLDLIFIALPASLIVLVIAYVAGRMFRLIPVEMSFGWLFIPTLGLAAGVTMIGFMVEDLVIWPSRLQRELIGHQLVTPVSLRNHSDTGFQDEVRTWSYEIDPATAARLARGCRPDPNPRVHSCGIAAIHESGPTRWDGRDIFIHMEGTTLTLEEWIY